MRCLPLGLTMPGVPKQLVANHAFVAALDRADAVARGILTIVGRPIWYGAGHSAPGPSQRMLRMRWPAVRSSIPRWLARCARSTTRVRSGIEHPTPQLTGPCERPTRARQQEGSEPVTTACLAMRLQVKSWTANSTA